METPYDVLRLNRTATQQEADQAYLQLMASLVEEQRSHPERRNELNLRIGEVSRAYDLLSRRERRVSDVDPTPGGRAGEDSPSRGRGGGQLDTLRGVASRSVILALALTLPVLLLIHVTIDSLSRLAEVSAQKAALNTSLELQKTVAETQRHGELERIALENKRLKEEIEIAKRNQERRGAELESQIDSQRRQLELMAQEQARRDRELEYKSGQEAKAMELRERETTIAELDAEVRRRQLRDAHNDDRVQTSVDNIYRTIDIMRDTQASRLGISRELYDRMVENRAYYGKE